MSSRNVGLMIFDSFAFKNSAPNSAFAADATTNFSIWHRVNITPLRWMGCVSCVVHPRKKCPSYWLRASLDDKYESSEWTCRIMADA